MSDKLLIGCVADDFTGASDAASFLAKSGMRTMLFNGVPKTEQSYEMDAAVIALKTRTEETGKAVEDSLEAVKWFQKQDACHIYSKYCSTFDSTPDGNIGPIWMRSWMNVRKRAVLSARRFRLTEGRSARGNSMSMVCRWMKVR